MNLLSKVNWENIRDLKYPELRQLAEEIREYIIRVVSETGGHLGSNLGAVELTISLLRNFNPLRDKIIWDTSHQAYTYKILTDRKERFVTLRQFGGISGFSSRKESPFDHYGAGHAGTALSVALGFAKARDLSGEDYNVVAVIGDASLTCGLSFEALNNLGYYPSKLIIVLNDNEYSISKNVGALTNHLRRLRSTPLLLKMEHKVKDLISAFPILGNMLQSAAKAIEHGLDYLTASKEPIFFDIFGLSYIGPVDGHDIQLLDEIFKLAKELPGPVIIHLQTVKGKGCEDAERHPERMHGISPRTAISRSFMTSETLKKVPVEEKVNKAPKYTDVFADALVEIASSDPDIVAITAAMPSGTGLKKFADKFPERFFDVGIAEEHAVLFAAGLAASGKKPVVAIYSTFLQRAYDMIIHDVALQELPILFAIDRGGIVGDDGPTHHGIFDLAYLRSVPNLKVYAPKDENELRHMLFTALRHLRGPVAIRYPRGRGVGVPLEPLREIDMNSWELLEDGKEVAILAVGRMVSYSRDALRVLREKGIYPTLVNARSVKPLDRKTLKEIADRHSFIVTVEDNILDGGFGSAVLEALNDMKVRGEIASLPSVLRLGWEGFIPHGDIEILLNFYGLDSHGIAERVANWLRDIKANLRHSLPEGVPSKVRSY